MREIALFGEDSAHQQIVGALVERLARKHGIGVRLDWRNAVGGHGRVVQEAGRYLRDLARQSGRSPHLIVVATDANCKGWEKRARELRDRKEFRDHNSPPPIVLAIPDPHVERWLLLDSAAFKTVFGRGCKAPDRKCERGRYKRSLAEAIRGTGIEPALGGVEFAEDVVEAMNLRRIGRGKKADGSLRRFVEELGGVFRNWQS